MDNWLPEDPLFKTPANGATPLPPPRFCDDEDISRPAQVLRGNPTSTDFNIMIIKAFQTWKQANATGDGTGMQALYRLTPSLLEAVCALLPFHVDHERAFSLVGLVDQVWGRYPPTGGRRFRRLGIEPLESSVLEGPVTRLVAASASSWPQLVREGQSRAVLRIFRAAEKALGREVVPRKLLEFQEESASRSTAMRSLTDILGNLKL